VFEAGHTFQKWWCNIRSHRQTNTVHSIVNSCTNFCCTGTKNTVADAILGTENVLLYTFWTSATSAWTENKPRMFTCSKQLTDFLGYDAVSSCITKRSVFCGWTSVYFWNLKWDRYMFVESEKENASAVQEQKTD